MMPRMPRSETTRPHRLTGRWVVRVVLGGCVGLLGEVAGAQQLPPTPQPESTPVAAQTAQAGQALGPVTNSPPVSGSPGAVLSPPIAGTQLMPPPSAPNGMLLPPPPAPGTSWLRPNDAGLEDHNGDVLRGDPLLEHYGSAGFIASLEAEVLKPHLVSKVTGDATYAPFASVTTPTTVTVAVPVAPLTWTVSPRVMLGYRFSEGLGEVTMAYRSIVSDGNGTVTPADQIIGGGSLRTRLNVNILDLDYATAEAPLQFWPDGPRPTTLQWRAGVRMASIYYDTNAEVGYTDGTVLAERISNNFIGAGPRGGGALWQPLDACGLPTFSLYTRVDSGVIIGRVTQHYEQGLSNINPAPGDPLGIHGSGHVAQTQAVPTLAVEAGMSWNPTGTRRPLRFSAGYYFESWWYLGALDVNSVPFPNDAYLTVQGFFLRGELGF